MRLVDYEPRFQKYAHGDDRLTSLSFRCPCSPTCGERIRVPFSPALDGTELAQSLGPWQRSSGDAFETITLAPSINFCAEDGVGCKGWHGYLRNGNLETC